ncbi:MAG: hypothetical protein J1E04_04955 [Alistipes sp.]|nr:hypothetical protein [Alistipes sp.]
MNNLTSADGEVDEKTGNFAMSVPPILHQGFSPNSTHPSSPRSSRRPQGDAAENRRCRRGFIAPNKIGNAGTAYAKNYKTTIYDLYLW